LASVLDNLEKSKGKKNGRVITKMDRWLNANPDKVKEFEQALEWFRENRSQDFGWRRFAEVMRETWPDFPDGRQHFQKWCQGRYDL